MRGRERGSGTVLVLGVIGVIAALLLGAMALISATVAGTRARTAADLAALAAAGTLLRPGSGDATPCSVAAAVARSNGGALRDCTIVGESVQLEVAVASSWPGLGPAGARSRAGPAEVETIDE